MKTRNWKAIGITVLSFILAALMFMAGAFKLAGAEALVADFERFGLPLWFLTVTGAVELAGAALLLLGRTRFYGAMLLAGATVGGVIVHVAVSDPIAASVPAAVLATASGLVAWAKRPSWLPLIGARAVAPE